MKFKIFALSLTYSLLAGAALASTTVIGQSHGTSCYQIAKEGRTGNNAIATCDLALTDSLLTNKDKASTYVNRGIIRSRSGDIEGAISDYDMALQINPELGEAFANRGTAFIRKSMYNKALKEFNHALALDLEQPAATYFNRATVYERLGDVVNAYKDYKRATELRPQWELPLTELRRFSVISD